MPVARLTLGFYGNKFIPLWRIVHQMHGQTDRMLTL